MVHNNNTNNHLAIVIGFFIAGFIISINGKPADIIDIACELTPTLKICGKNASPSNSETSPFDSVAFDSPMSGRGPPSLLPQTFSHERADQLENTRISNKREDASREDRRVATQVSDKREDDNRENRRQATVVSDKREDENRESRRQATLASDKVNDQARERRPGPDSASDKRDDRAREQRRKATRLSNKREDGSREDRRIATQVSDKREDDNRENRRIATQNSDNREDASRESRRVATKISDDRYDKIDNARGATTRVAPNFNPRPSFARPLNNIANSNSNNVNNSNPSVCPASCAGTPCTKLCKCTVTRASVHAKCSPPASSSIATFCQAWYGHCPMFKPDHY